MLDVNVAQSTRDIVREEEFNFVKYLTLLSRYDGNFKFNSHWVFFITLILKTWTQVSLKPN